MRHSLSVFQKSPGSGGQHGGEFTPRSGTLERLPRRRFSKPLRQDIHGLARHEGVLKVAAASVTTAWADPPQSMLEDSSSRVSGTWRTLTGSTMTATGALIRKIQRHERQPPAVEGRENSRDHQHFANELAERLFQKSSITV